MKTRTTAFVLTILMLQPLAVQAQVCCIEAARIIMSSGMASKEIRNIATQIAGVIQKSHGSISRVALRGIINEADHNRNLLCSNWTGIESEIKSIDNSIRTEELNETHSIVDELCQVAE